MPAPLVDYDKYRAEYTGPWFKLVAGDKDPRTGKRPRKMVSAVVFNAPQGSFKLGLLEPAGVRVRQLLHSYLGGRKERHRGAAKGSVYFKFVVKQPDDANKLRVAADEIRDMGYEVEVAHSNNRYDGTLYIKLIIKW